MEEILSEIKNNLIDLYLKVKIRKTIETITIDSDFLDNEKKNLNKLSALDIIKYIKSHLQILIEIQVSEKINEIKNEINENSNEININNYEILLRRYEADIRNYIKIENMLKIHIDDLNFKIENLEKTIEKIKKNSVNKNILEYQKKIENLTNIIKNYEKSNLIIPELEKKIKFQKIELDKMDEYYKNQIKIFNKKIEKYEKNDFFNQKKIQISNYNSYKSNTNNSNNNNNTTLKKKKKTIISNNNDSSFLIITNNNFYNSPKFNTMTQRSLCNYDSCEKEKSTDYKTKNKKNNYSTSKKNNSTKKIILQNKNYKKALQKIPKSTSNIISKKNSMIIENNNNNLNQIMSNKNKKIRLNKSNNNSNICRDLNTTLSNINIEKIPSCVNYINIYSTINNDNKENININEKEIIHKKFNSNKFNFKRCSTEKKLFNDNLNKTLPPKKKSNSRSKTKSFVNKFN